MHENDAIQRRLSSEYSFMIRLLGLIIVGTLVLAVSGAPAAANGPDWGQLAVWNGHYPADRLGIGKLRFFEQPLVARRLSSVLPPSEWTLLRRSYQLGDTFSVIGHYLIGDMCRPHDCGAENGTMVFDLSGRDVWVAMFSHVGDTVSTRWFGTADCVDLPPAVLAAVLAVHRPVL